MADLAKAWSKYLPEDHRTALHTALCLLSDDFFENPLDDRDHPFREALPSGYLHHYTPLFLRHFYATLLTIGYKLALPKPKRPQTILACTAEELAMHMLIEAATAVLDMDGKEADFDAFEDEVFQDWDFKLLYESDIDGFEDSPAGSEGGFVNLHFSDWFKPFADASLPAHPLCQPG